MKDAAEIKEICEVHFDTYATVKHSKDGVIVSMGQVFWNFESLRELSDKLDTKLIDISADLDWSGCYYPGEQPEVEVGRGCPVQEKGYEGNPQHVTGSDQAAERAPLVDLPSDHERYDLGRKDELSFDVRGEEQAAQEQGHVQHGAPDVDVRSSHCEIRAHAQEVRERVHPISALPARECAVHQGPDYEGRPRHRIGVVVAVTSASQAAVRDRSLRQPNAATLRYTARR